MSSDQIDITDEGQHYHSYLLRLWRVKTTDGWNWQASLESATSRKMHGFPDLESLFTYLKIETETSQNQGKCFGRCIRKLSGQYEHN